MLTEREKILLYQCEYLTDSELEKFTDEEIIDNISKFLSIKEFTASTRYFRIIDNATPEILQTMYENNLEFSLSIPTIFNRKDLVKALEKGMKISKTEFTRNWMYICSSADDFKKYKEYIDFDLLVREDRHIPDELIETCYEELSKVFTWSLLQRMEQSTGTKFENSYEKARLLDKLENISNRKFSNDAFIMRLLKGFMDVPYTNPDYYKEIFEYIDDQYIIEHFLLFNPLQLVYAERFTEEMYQKVIDNETMFSKYGHELQRLVTDLSLEFLLKNKDKLNPYFYSFQKNAVKFLKINPREMHPEIMYFHNTYLSDDELEYVRNLIKDTPIDRLARCMKRDDYIPPLAIERLSNLKGDNNE